MPTPPANLGPGEPRPGDHIAERYEVVRRLGAGGMGQVYEVIQRPLERRVALKLLPSATGADAVARARFEAEAETIGRLHHPNNITLFDFGHTAEGSPYLVMELCRGPSLSDVLGRRARLPPRLAIALGVRICDAVAEAHRCGIVHRDLKPSNIMLDVGPDDPDGLRVLDYGIARGPDHPDLTRPGGIIGTPAYMAPEQARGQRADARSDVYAIGAILYRMLAGRRPIVADESRELLLALQTEIPVPLDRIEPPLAIDPSLVALLQLTLAKDPDHRPRDAAALGAALRALAEVAPREGTETLTITGDSGAGDGSPPIERGSSSTRAPVSAPPLTPSTSRPQSADGDSRPSAAGARARPGRAAALASVAVILGAVGFLMFAAHDDPPRGHDEPGERADAIHATARDAAPPDSRPSPVPDAAPPRPRPADTGAEPAPTAAGRPTPREATVASRPRIRLTGCQTGASRDDLCRRLPTEALVACRRRSGLESRSWRVDVIVKADASPAVRSQPPLGRADRSCLEAALVGVRPPADVPFATLQFELSRR